VISYLGYKNVIPRGLHKTAQTNYDQVKYLYTKGKFMAYSNILLMINQGNDVMQVLHELAISKFQAIEVHKLSDGSFNIDGGLNDTRAIIDEQEQTIHLICRYERDVLSTTKKLTEFAAINEYSCRLLA
jgi:hypothetical protein